MATEHLPNLKTGARWLTPIMIGLIASIIGIIAIIGVLGHPFVSS